jgi:hypothetical protein
MQGKRHGISCARAEQFLNARISVKCEIGLSGRVRLGREVSSQTDDFALGRRQRQGGVALRLPNRRDNRRDPLQLIFRHAALTSEYEAKAKCCQNHATMA